MTVNAGKREAWDERPSFPSFPEDRRRMITDLFAIVLGGIIRDLIAG